ncbi:hypothetical protein T09_12891, partial [Trichinella sp. T9]
LNAFHILSICHPYGFLTINRECVCTVMEVTKLSSNIKINSFSYLQILMKISMNRLIKSKPAFRIIISKYFKFVAF